MEWVGYSVVFFVLAPVLSVAERLGPESETGAPVPPRRVSRLTDWGFALTGLAVVPALWLAFGLVVAVESPYAPLRAPVAALPPAARVALGFMACDLAAYWIHRLEHRFPVFWRFHSVHHSPSRLDWLAGRRFHPLDLMAQQLGPVIVVAVTGLPLTAVGPYLLAATVVTVLAHCDLSVPAGRFGWLVVLPGYHRSHHEVGRDGSNFALVLPLMDRLFRTASLPVGPRSFGAPPPVPADGFWALVAWGFGCAARFHHTKMSSPVEKDRALAT